MIDLNKEKQKIISVGLYFNLIVLILSIFYFQKWIIITSIVFNIILMGTFVILTKYGMLFSGIIGVNRMARKLNDNLVKLN